MRIGSLFAGIGGFDLAARWMGWETAWFSEIDPYASAVLAKHWPDVPNLGDITCVYWSTVEPVDLLCGGFPCQPVSVAGKQKAQADERWLWPEFARAIRALRPRWVVAENVPGLLSRGFGDVLGDLAAIGYDAEWTVLSAADVGAPHLRERVWIVAHPNGARGDLEPRLPVLPREGLPDTHRGRWRSAGTRGEDVAHATRELFNGSGHAGPRRGAEPPDSGWWEAEPGLGRVVNGLPDRVDRLKCLGNAIVPQCAYAIFTAIQAAEDRMTEAA